MDVDIKLPKGDVDGKKPKSNFLKKSKVEADADAKALGSKSPITPKAKVDLDIEFEVKRNNS